MTISIIRSSPIWTPFSEQRSSKIGRSRRKRPSRNRSPFRRSGKCVAFSVNRDSIDAFNRMTSDPDFDDLVLDDQFYEDIEEDREELEKNPPWAPEATDPKGYNMSLEDYLEGRSDIPDYVKRDLRDAQYFGPPTLIVAGFRLEELPMLRHVTDELLGKHVKVIPVFGSEILNMTVEEALKQSEPNWTSPRPDDWKRGGMWGSQRTILFGGLALQSQAAMLEVIEESGLPPVCVSIASEETRNMKLGEVLADSIRLQRDRKNPEKQLWETEERVVDDATDLKGFYTEKLKERLEKVRNGLESGTAELEEDEEKGVMNVKMEGWKDEIFDPEEISVPLKSGKGETKAGNTESKKEPGASRSRPSSGQKRGFRATSTREDDEASEENEDESETESVDDFDVVWKEDDWKELEERRSDFFAVDDLISSELGVDSVPKAEKPSPDISIRSRQTPLNGDDRRKTRKDDRPQGRTYEISTEPKTIAEGVKHSTVFSGLVDNADAFLKDNFGYDSERGGITRTAEEEEKRLMTFDVTSQADQEAFEALLNENNATEDDEEKEDVLDEDDEEQFLDEDDVSDEEDVSDEDVDQEVDGKKSSSAEASVQDIVQAALKKGIDPEQLKSVIDALAEVTASEKKMANDPSKRPAFRTKKSRKQA